MRQNEINNKVKISKISDFADFMAKKHELQLKQKMSKLMIIDFVSKRVDEQYHFLKEQNERIETIMRLVKPNNITISIDLSAFK